MTKKIFRAVLLGTIAVLVFTTVMLSGIMYRYMTQVSERQLRTQLNLASRGLTLEGTKYFRSLNDENVRITWIDRNGKVLYDSSRSDVSGMENHRDRKEVQEALQKGYGESERYSTTLTEKMLYAARRQPDGTVLRMSVSQYSVWMLLVGMIQPFVIIIIVAVLLSLLLASRLSKRVVKPLNDVDLDHPLENEGCDEIAPILRKIDYQQRQLARQEQSLDRQQDELNTILQNMAEGMILLRRGGKIISINNPAAEILGITGDHTGESLLQICRNLELEELVRKGLDGTPAEQVLALESGRYQVQVMPVREDKEIRGVTVVLFDVTDRELAEQMRREFTANVSHELKRTSITFPERSTTRPSAPSGWWRTSSACPIWMRARRTWNSRKSTCWKRQRTSPYIWRKKHQREISKSWRTAKTLSWKAIRPFWPPSSQTWRITQ